LKKCHLALKKALNVSTARDFTIAYWVFRINQFVNIIEALSRVLDKRKRIKILIFVTLISSKLNKLNNLCVIELTFLSSGLMKTSKTGAINRVLATWTKQTKVSIKILKTKRRGYFL
jgi:hypothetical protein